MMVETANQPEITLRPDFRSDAEVKLMKTLNKPRKVTGVKAGKIPLVKSKKNTGTWPAGNPTAVKFQHENAQYEHAEDEPYYASKEVERLEDKIETQHAPSDIIARITVTRKERHKRAIEDLHTELGHLNKSLDPEIGDTLEMSKLHLDGILSEIQILFSGIQQDRILYSYPLKKLEALWDDVVAMLQKRSQVIETLHTDLEKAEADRAKQIAEIFKHYNILFREIAFLSNDAIEVLMDSVMFSSNILLVSNYKNYTKIISQLKIENIVKLRERRGKWEERLATWRDLHANNMKDSFVKFMNTPGIAQSPDISNLIALMKKEQSTLSDRRLNKLKCVLELRPPTCTENLVLKWYEEVCDISRLLENMHSNSLSHLESIGERIVRECEEVADKMLANLILEGVCSEEEAAELKEMELMPLIHAWRVRTEELGTQMDRELNDVAAKFNADVHILYQFKSASSRVWMNHQESVRTKYNLLMEKMNVCRVKHDEINQHLETDLDIYMDRMRQDTNEVELLASLDKSLNALKEIAASYDNFQVDMSEVIKCYPEMISCDVVEYSDNLCSLLRVKHLTKGGDEEEGEEGEVNEAPPAPVGEIIQANNEQYLVEKEEDSSTFLTETTGATDSMEFGCDVAVPQSQFATLHMSIIELYLCHLENWKIEVMSNAKDVVDSKINELKSEVELRHHIHAPRPIRMELDIYNVRVSELKKHSERVKQHTAGIILEITTLRNNFKDLTLEQSGKGKEFRELVEQCEQALATLDKTAHLTSLQSKVTAAYDEHMSNIRVELADFRKKMEDKLNDLRESNQQFGLAFKPFAEGGNFGPDEIEVYQKKLEKCVSKIDNCETFILTELDGMESKCLDMAVEVTTNFDSKLKLHILDVAFLEKINSWISNCQVRIKTEVAACNMMSKKLKDNIGVLHKLIDNCARPHPDKTLVRPEEVLAAIPSVYSLFQDRIAYLDCAKVIQQPLVKMSQSTSEDTPVDSLDSQSAVNLTKNILKLARKKTELEDSEVFDKKKVSDVKYYDWFIPREEKDKVVTKRGKSRGDTAERTKRSGSASSRNSHMSLIITEATSFMPIIKKILQEAQEALYLSSEACYAQYQGPPLREEIADSLELCMENLNKRLNYYYVQAEEYYNKCIQELRGLLADVLNLHMEVPKLLFSEILEEYVTSVSQKTCDIKHNFDKNKVKIDSRRESNKVMLKPILGHPNNEHDLNNLCRNEESRIIESSDVLNEFVNEMKNVETDFVKRFIESMNDCTQRLFTLFDQLITTDDVILGQVQEKKLPASVLLKKEQKGLLAGGKESVCNLSKSGQQIKLLELSDITQRPSSHSSSRSNKMDNIINTNKFTPIHQETLASKDEVYEEYKRHYLQTIGEIEEISVRYSERLEMSPGKFLQTLKILGNAMPTAPSSKELRLLRPSTRCATITPRPHDYKSASGGAKALAGGSHYQPATPENVPNAFLTSVGEDDYNKVEQRFTGEELLAQLKDKVKGRHSEIKQAFYAFDGDRSSYVTLSELKKIVENFIFPLTSFQFDDLVKRIDGVSGNKINYNQFLFKISNKKKRESPVLGRITPANNSLDSIVQKLQDKLQDNITKISKGMRMFDHQNNGKLRKADLKRVLENFAFHMTREQFEKIYSHYDMSRDGTIEYIPFLKRVMSTTIPIKPSGTSPTQELVIFEEAEEEHKAEIELATPAEPLWCQTVPLVDVEIKLRNKIKHRIQLLYRTFSSMDMHSDGYITIDQLRRALEKFAFPMTDNIFSKLMERMEVKAKHKLRYETFLYKFQDRRVGGYGQALVMKPNHRYHPVIESSEEATLESIIERLKSKIVNGYSSIKQAFLVFDENKSGRVNRKDFKNVIDGFCFRMSEAQFNKLMSAVDPGNKGYVTYQHFFQMFEQTESSESHKWLNSVHKSNTAREHKQLEDVQFEELLQKKISDESKMVAIAFTNFDKEGNGTISKRQLSKFLERFSVPFSKAQFDKLVARCESNSDGTLNFYHFMEKIGVDLQVCDYGYSNKIQADNDSTENDRQDKHRQRLEVVAQRALDHTGGLTVDSIVQQLQDYIHQRASDIRKLFIRYDEEGNGRLKRAQFRKFLIKAGFMMDNAQFKELCDRMKIGRSLTYTDFLDHFQRTATQEYKDHRVKVPVLVPGAPVQAMPCVEGLRLLHSKLHNSFNNLRAAFQSMDRDSDGLVNRTDLVAMLTNLLIPMIREDINEMWEVIAKGKKKLNVKEFTTAFEETENVESHKWLVSVHHTNTTIAPKELQGDAVLKMFRMKALDHYFSLNKCFMALDKDGKGKLSKKKLRQALSDFTIPINNDEFLKLWKHFDDDRTGYIDHEQFVRRAAEDFNPGDNAGCSTNIVKSHDDEVEQHNNQQMYRRDELLMKQINTLKCVSVDQIEKQFRDNLQENFSTVRQAFKAIDKENLGYIRKSDLRRILFDFNFLVDDDQFDAILQRCGMADKSRLSYKTFLAFFEGPQTKQAGIENFESFENKIAPYIDSYPDIENKDAENKMKFMVSEISDVLLQAFSAMDWKESGLVLVEELRRVLNNFCFNMTDKQFNFMIKKVPIVSDGRLDYKEFLKSFPITEDDTSIDIETLRKESKGWLEAVLGRSESAMTTDSIPRLKSRLSRRSQSCTNLLLKAQPDSSPFVSAEHIEAKLVESVKHNWMGLHKYYKQHSDDNHVSTEIFQAGLESVGIVLSVMDLSILCKKYDSKGSHRIAFKEFLRKFTVSGRVSGMSGRVSAANSRDSRMSSSLSFSYNLSRAASCTSLDSYRSPSADTVRSVSRNLVTQMKRSNTTLGDLTPGPGIEPPAYVLEKVAPHVTAKWRELRKGFKSVDKASKRWVTTADFRTVMRDQHIDIAETDFSDLVSFYMAHSGGKVFYNDFLRAFLSVTAVG